MSISSFIQIFVPKDKKCFFPLFESAAGNVVAMAGLLVDAVNSADAGIREALFKQIAKLEHKGDDITHQVHIELGRHLVTPFDKKDIHSLASAIDDVADYIHGTANRMNIYLFEDYNEHINKLAALTLQACIDLEKAVKQLKDLKNVRSVADCCIRINSLENQADCVFERAMADLFLYQKDAIKLIKSKEILETLETATDRCEDAANVMESILIKKAS